VNLIDLSSEEICEALVRHVEVMGSEVFEKNFVKDGKTLCSIWCIVGSNAEQFRDAARRWLAENGFKED
jgi:hypothetical protein